MTKIKFWDTPHLVRKVIINAIERLVEIAILVFAGSWVWNHTWPEYKLYIVGALVVSYLIYFVVTTMNDYHELKYGVGEPMQ